MYAKSFRIARDIRQNMSVTPNKPSSEQSSSSPLNIEDLRTTVNKCIETLSAQLRELNKDIHSHPETAYQEVFAHETITSFLEQQGFDVTRRAYGLGTSFEADSGAGDRLVVFCAEYDALPGIGHACGHNLIATSSIAAFVAAARSLQSFGILGRVRILGTPAEEGGGGKAKLIEAGAFEGDVAAAIMAHPMASHQYEDGVTGLAGLELIASHKFHVEFRGKPSHAAGEPWNGLNALDAAVAAYNNVSMLRQQMEPDERVHGVIENGGTVPNVITEFTRMNWNVRSPNIKRCNLLLERVKCCFEAAALATGCKLTYITAPTYMNLRVNEPLCQQYVEDMAMLGETIKLRHEKAFNASTDMGNVSYTVPSFHGAFAIPTPDGVAIHNPEFAEAAGTDRAHEVALQSARGMAMLGLRVLIDGNLAESAKKAFIQRNE